MQKQIKNAAAKGSKFTDKTPKLMADLHSKKNYIVHWSALKLYLELGLKLTKVHRAISYKQSAWMWPFIELCYLKRAEAKHKKNGLLSDYYKLVMNAVYGKTMKDVRKHTDYQFALTAEKQIKIASSPRFCGFISLTPDLTGNSMSKAFVLLDKPIYVGQAILDLSKVVMYRMYYKVLKPIYGDDLALSATDTDSLKIRVQTADFYRDVYLMNRAFEERDNLIDLYVDLETSPEYADCLERAHRIIAVCSKVNIPHQKRLFDTSEFAVNGANCENVNLDGANYDGDGCLPEGVLKSGYRDFRFCFSENGLGLFKSEMSGTPISEIHAIRAKVYHQRVNKEDASEKIKSKWKCKGVNATASKKLTREDYHNALYNEVIVKANVTIFGVMRDPSWPVHQAMIKKTRSLVYRRQALRPPEQVQHQRSRPLQERDPSHRASCTQET